jgi:hypothetical protein
MPGGLFVIFYPSREEGIVGSSLSSFQPRVRAVLLDTFLSTFRLLQNSNDE